MPEFLYRFRKPSSLLGEYRELEKQGIFFSAPDALNDPMEGYKDLYWRGDEIVWRNLLKHYLICLDHITFLFLVGGSNYSLTDKDIAVHKTAKDFPTDEYRHIFQDICEFFFAEPKMTKYPMALASRISPIRRNELLIYLRHLHYHAINSVFSIYEKYGLYKERPANDTIRTTAADHIMDYVALDMMNKVETENPKHPDIADQIYSAQRNIYSANDLTTQANNPLFSTENNKRFVLFEFPERYIRQLENLVHPDWYTACFLTNCNNASMWGHYGDNHKGVCLKFKTTKDENGKPFISLYAGTEASPQKHKPGSARDWRMFPFYKLHYEDTYPEIDFFRSLGQLPIPALEANWYMENDKRSACADDVFKDQDAWRSQFWDAFQKGISTKLKDWAYEEEYRIVLMSFLTDYREAKTRAFKYDFSDLEGIVFGIKTPDKDKIDILNVIKSKCQGIGRKDFKFYQAYYAKSSGKIETAELLIKI